MLSLSSFAGVKFKHTSCVVSSSLLGGYGLSEVEKTTLDHELELNGFIFDENSTLDSLILEAQVLIMDEPTKLRPDFAVEISVKSAATSQDLITPVSKNFISNWLQVQGSLLKKAKKHLFDNLPSCQKI